MTSEEHNRNSEEEVFVFPASYAQQRLWFLDQLVPDASLYNVPTVIRLTGVLNLVALEQSFKAIVCRHEALRTTFNTLEGQPIQVIAPSLKVSLSLINLQSLPAMASGRSETNDREAEAQRLIWEEVQHPFNLSQGPLLRLKLLQVNHAEHILLVNLHHIVFDEWSSGVLIRELSALYTAFTQGQPASLPELPIQYADFAHWQREWLQGEVLAFQLNYWRQQLKDVPVLNLPSDRPRPPVQSYRGAIQLLELPQSLLSVLEELSQQEGVSLFMMLLAAFQTLLYRYTGQEDIAVGSPIANRNRSELEGLIGFFVNSLVLRTDLSGNPAFRELLGRVREVALGAYAHQDLPFEKLVEELQPIRDMSRNPLFQVVFALQNAPMEQLELPGLTLSSLNFETRTTRFDFELYLWKCSDNFRSLWGKGWEDSQGLRGVAVYNTDLFEPESITRLLRHFQTLLQGIVANPAERLANLPTLTATERQQLLIDWNNTQTDYPANQCIHQLFQAQAEQSPNAVAVRFTDQQFTYQELNKGSNQLAHYLQKLGVGPDVLVGLCMERSPEAVAGMLGILKAGGAYVPLDPTYPPERLRFMLKDAQVAVLLTQRRFADLEECGVKVVSLDRDWQAIAQESEEDLISQVAIDNLAYVIYTSGSTGHPKGVAVTHRAVNRLVCNTNYVKLEPSDKVAQVSNISFDAATFEIWGALLNGAQLIGVSREDILSPPGFVAQVRQQEISVLFLTTALFNQIASVPGAFRSLRYLLFGGEMADPRSVRAVLEEPPRQLLHVYGPTENTTFTSWYRVEDVPEGATSIPIGRAIANTQVYLLDDYLNPVPIGVSGEIYIGGDGLARGYLNRPELTAERFVPNPFSSQPNARLYKSGDLGRYRPDGNIEFLGRVDDQVKLRGFRIELGEIEAVLGQHQAVREAVAVVQEIESDAPEEPLHNQRLVAYIVPQHQASVKNSDLRHFLRLKLPDYMVPSTFVILKTLPLTPNGKVDRRALHLAEAVRTEAPEVVVPRTSTEATLVEIWTKLLGVQAGVHDNFFELGGHSLLATQLVSRICNTFQVEVPLRRLFETPTIAELAQYIETVSWAQGISKSGSGENDSVEVMRSSEADQRSSRSVSSEKSQNREEVEL
jgi:amino acid adenylation domain-containing protein